MLRDLCRQKFKSKFTYALEGKDINLGAALQCWITLQIHPGK